MRPSFLSRFKVLVPVKRTVDYAVKVRVKPDSSGVETENVKHSMNPFDEIALEESLRLRTKHEGAPDAHGGKITEIVACSVGPAKCSETLRTALAFGADSAIHYQTPDNASLEPLGVAKILAALVKKSETDIVIMGKQAIDGDTSQTGPMLAAILGWPQATFSSKVEVQKDGKTVLVSREVDGGIEDVSVPIPCVITVDLRLNTPRFVSLPNIMKAKKKTISSMSAEELGLKEDKLRGKLTVIKTEEPPVRPVGVIVDTVKELVAKMKAAGVV